MWGQAFRRRSLNHSKYVRRGKPGGRLESLPHNQRDKGRG